MAKTAPVNDLVVSLLAATDGGQRARQLAAIFDGRTAPEEAILTLAREAGLRAWRSSYGEGVNQGFVDLVAAIELAARFPSLRDQALLRAVEQLHDEGLAAPLDMTAWRFYGDLGESATADALDEACGRGDFQAFHTRLVPFVNEEPRRHLGHRYIYMRSVLDTADGGHRQILMGRTARLMARVAYRHTEATLFPAAHHFVSAVPDYGVAQALEAHLESAGEFKGDNRNRAVALEPARLARLTAGMLEAEPANVIAEVGAAWDEKASLEAIAEAGQVAALRLLRAGAPEAWALPVRAYLYADAVVGSLPWLRGPMGMNAVSMLGLFVRAAAAMTPPVREIAEPGPVAAPSLRALEAALAGGDRVAAMAQTAALAAVAEKDLAEALARAALRDPTGLRHGHDIPMAEAALTAAGRSGAKLKLEHFLGLADYLTR